MVLGNADFTGNTYTRGLRRRLLAGAALTLPILALSAGAASAQITIDDDTTTAVDTATSGDVVITEDGSIELDSGTALTLNSDNDVDMSGRLAVGHVDDAVGLLIVPGFTGDIDFDGFINLDRTEAQEDENDDEIVSDYADNRHGILLQAGGTHTGDILGDAGSAIQLFGDNSSGIEIAGNLDGDMLIDGDIGMAGANSQALAIHGNVSGDVDIGTSASYFIEGVDSNAILIDGSIDGAFILRGSVAATGYIDETRDAPDDEDNNNEEQAALQSGAAVDISGDIANGILIQGPVPVGDRPEDYVAPSSASITVRGSAPALHIHDGAQLGAVDTSDLNDGYGDWGLANRGNIAARGIYSGVTTIGVLVEDATIEGGIRNDGSMRAESLSADATAVRLSDISLDDFLNFNTIEASIVGEDGINGDFTATGLLIDADASLPTLTNRFRISAAVAGDEANAVALRDESGTLTEIFNYGIIRSTVVDIPDDEDTPPSGDVIAVDVSANTTGVTLRNTVPDEFDPEADNRSSFGQVFGDVLFGSGDDQYLIDAGVSNGDVFLAAGDDTMSMSQNTILNGSIDFGAGDDIFMLDDSVVDGALEFGLGLDTFMLDNEAFYRGSLTDEDGQLDVTVSGGATLYETGLDPTLIRNLTVGAQSTLGIGIGEGGSDVASFTVSDTALLEDGATIQPVFLGGAIESVSANIITAGTLNVDPDAITVGDAEGNQPFLFNITFDTVMDGPTQNLVLNVQRRTAEELGLQEGLAPAYVPTLEALATDDTLGPLVLNYTQEADFRDALSQLLAGPLDAPIAYARAQNNSVTSIITQRLDMARNAGAYPRTFWLQEETYFLDRESDEVSNGFDGGGFSLAAGVDAGLDNFVDAIGLSASISSAKYDEKKGGDFPFERLTYGLGAYAAFSLGDLQMDTRAEYAISSSESERNIVIGNVQRRVLGEWDGTQLAANARLRYQTEISGFTAEPFVSADFITIDEDAYEETGGGNGIDLAVSDRTYESLRANVGLRVGKVYELTPSAYDTGIPGTIHPQLTLAWSQELMTDPLEAEYQYLSGGDAFTLFADPENGSAIVGADVAYENEYAKIHLGVSGTLGDTTNAVILRAGVGLKW